MSETRMPKEVRNSKSELTPSEIDMPGADSSFWAWADERRNQEWELRDGGSETPVPPSDLLERTALFGEPIVRFVKQVPRGREHPENNRLVDQLIGVATSIGANYCEADDSVSGKDYRNKIGTCRKESKEAMFFLRMVAASEERLAEEARKLWREAKELNLIFGSIWRKRR